MSRPVRACLVAVVAALGVAVISAQLRIRPIDLEDGAVALGLALRQLNTTAVFMQMTAHPDDENNALHVYFNRGLGIRTVLATATRGDGGQNEIGPELADPLAVLRTGELEAMHRFDSTEQYFTRAVDFGYSFSIEETMEKWGRDEIVSDYVRLIRMTRPDVIVAMNPTGTAGGLHHQTAGLLSREAFKAAGDAARYPDQIRDGLPPWQPRKFYYTFGGPGGGGQTQAPAGGPLPLGALNVASLDLSAFDAILGRTYSEVGTEERGMHKSQAMAPLLALPTGRTQARYLLMDSFAAPVQGEETSIFRGVDTTMPGLSSMAGATPPPALVAGLREIADRAAAAQKQFDLDGPFASAPEILAGLRAVRALRAQLSTLGLTPEARFNLDFRLKTKEDQFTEAAALAHGLRVEVLANDGLVVRGQEARTTIVIGDRGRPVSLTSIAFEGFSGTASCPAGSIELGGVYRCEAALRIPTDARITKPHWRRPPDSARYELEPDAPFGVPFRPTPFRAVISLNADGTSLTLNRPVQYRYQGANLEGEKRMELTVVPRLEVRVLPPIVVVPAARGGGAPPDREVRITVTNHGTDAVSGQVAAQLSAPGLNVAPLNAAVSFTREDESQTVRFTIRGAAKVGLGDHVLRATATAGSETFGTGYQVVEYPHIQRRQLEVPASVTVKTMDVRVAPGLNVGYVMGTGDEVPAALRGLGATVSMLDAEELAWSDLSRYHAIMIGVRAYDSREDLRANNKRILDYAAAGGTVIVQYNRNENWTQYAPFTTGFSATRVTDENGKIEILSADDPLFHFPNEITDAAWQNWAQERGNVLHRSERHALHGFAPGERTVRAQPGVEEGCAGERPCRKGTLDLRGAWRVAPGHRRDRRRVPPSGKPRQPRKASRHALTPFLRDTHGVRPAHSAPASSRRLRRDGCRSCPLQPAQPHGRDRRAHRFRPRRGRCRRAIRGG